MLVRSRGSELNVIFQIKFRGPRVTIVGEKEDPALDFGFIHFRPGCSAQRQFEIVNQDGVHAKWSIAEVDHCIDKDYVSVIMLYLISEMSYSDTKSYFED